MSAERDPTAASTPATVVISVRIRNGCEDAHEAWQARMDKAAAGFAGFVGAEVEAPEGDATDWTVIYRFASVAQLQAWLGSDVRKALLDEGAGLHEGSETQQVITGGASSSEAVALVVSHRVPPGREKAFLAWQDLMTAAEQRFPGFVGADLFPPIAGIQDEWTAVCRFDRVENLRRWLDSTERRKLLDEGGFEDFQLRTVRSSFGSWFPDANRDDQPGPSKLKTSIAVWMGLYPTVMALSLAISRLMPDAELWQSLLVGNLLSSFVMTYLTMPWYVNRILGKWLAADRRSPQPKTDLQGFTVSVATVAAWAAFFWLVTVEL